MKLGENIPSEVTKAQKYKYCTLVLFVWIPALNLSFFVCLLTWSVSGSQ